MTKTEFYPVLERTREGSPQLREEEENYKSPISQKLTTDSLRTLLSIVERIERPSFAFSLIDMTELVTDLGVLLMNSNLIVNSNQEVFEHPFEKVDSLSNVLMIHRHDKKNDSEVLELLGQDLISLAELAKSSDYKTRKGFLSYDQDLYYLHPQDDCESEEILVAKKKIQSLRKENNQLDRRNEKLYTQLCKAKGQKAVLEERISKLQNKNNPIDYSTPEMRKLTSGVSEYAIPVEIKSFDEDGNRINQSRKLENDVKSDSQLESIKW